MRKTMTFNPLIHNRRSQRLPGYDYSRPGAYFVTMCVRNREYLFGEIQNNTTHLNSYGQIVKETWYDLPNHIGNVVLDEFVIMPNHIHGIIILVGAGSEPAPTNQDVPCSEPASTNQYMFRSEPIPVNRKKHQALPEVIRQLKTFSSRRINQHRKTPGVSVWQRNYYDHIDRNESELNRIRQYILNNPINWQYDEENIINKPPRYVAMLNPQKEYL